MAWRHQVDEEEWQPAADEASHNDAEYEESASLLGTSNASPAMIWILKPGAHRVGDRRPWLIIASTPPASPSAYDRLPYDGQVGADQETGSTQSVSLTRLLSTTWTTAENMLLNF